ncbi:endonuclease/exonuclease/phosphatase family protein [Zobellella iuensis]|uniref:Endonuclease/exonuclease/phosphatase family protein n=1 Tax=Zobellella iuensis TaxID=2803811 RepID=A0ABS1QMG0_9GAMM|nr:endonuclease/exonuclease/phosphatase family protein [Zobellella iuensis]MBL1376054.1 endonuclease/exonuclease/phosphatase family protein [Zobellella iuensis]
MLRPRIAPHQLGHQHQQLDRDGLGVLCWNTQKLTLNPEFRLCLTGLMQRFPTSLLLLQEAKLALHSRLQLEGWSYAVSPNIQTPAHLFGVLTAGQCAFDEVTALLSRTRELRFATHKSLILTRHPLAGGEQLLVVNVHAINFVHHGLFHLEMEQLKRELLLHKGPLIVAGDFNVWSRRRWRYLTEFCLATGLQQAVMEDPHHIKHYFRQPLDFIFYRDLILHSATAINTDMVSDHNPIYARFSV